MILQGAFLFILFLLTSTAVPVEITDLFYQSYNSFGEVTQFEYAAKAVGQSPAVIAFSAGDKGIVMAFHQKISPLIPQENREKRIFCYKRRLVSIPVGYNPDCRAMSVQLINEISQFSMKYGTSPPVKYLSTKLADWSVRGLFPSEEVEVRRPYASAMILCSRSEPLFSYVGNTGVVHSRSSIMVGQLSEENRRKLEEITESTSDDESKRREILGCLSDDYEYYETCVIDSKKKTVEITDITPLKPLVRKS